MVARYQIVRSTIPTAAISAFRTLSRAKQLEPVVAPRFAQAFESWLKQVAQITALQYPKRSGRSSRELFSSARVRGGSALANITGYFLVAPSIAANEYGASITPKNARKLAIPLPDALRADGSPKRIGPRSWAPLGTFVYRSPRTGGLYIAYRSKARGLVLLYTLVDRVQVPAKRTLRDNYDRMLPRLFALWNQILGEEINRIYSQAYIEELTKAEISRLPKLPPRPPSAATYSAGLLPRYQR